MVFTGSYGSHLPVRCGFTVHVNHEFSWLEADVSAPQGRKQGSRGGGLLSGDQEESLVSDLLAEC